MIGQNENSYKKLKEKGRKCLDGRDLNPARVYFTDYLRKVPDDTEALNWLGQIFRDKNEFAKARECFQKVLSINPKDEIALYGMADVLKEEGNLEEALSFVQEVLSSNDNHGWAHHIAGYIFTRKEDYARAEEKYRKALEIMPDNTVVRTGLVQVLARAGKVEDCFNICLESLEINEDTSEIIRSICVYLWDEGKTGEVRDFIQKLFARYQDKLCLMRALAYLHYMWEDHVPSVQIYEKLSKLHPRDNVLARCLAEIAKDNNDLDRALYFYERLIKEEPANQEVMRELADIYTNQRLLDKARRIYEKLLAIDADNPAYLKSLAGIYRRQNLPHKADGLYEKVISLYNRELEKNPDEADILMFLGDIYRDGKEYDRALACYDRVLEIRSDSDEAYFGKGSIALDNKQFPAAEKNFLESLKYNPDNLYSLHGLGDVYKQFNRYEEAKKLYSRCVQLNPLFTSAYLGLGDILVKQRRFDEAIEEFNKLLKIDPEMEEAKRELNWAMREKKRYELASLSVSEGKVCVPGEADKEMIKPRFCALGVTYRCNFRCKMCHIWENRDRDELSIAQWKKFLSSFKKVADDHCQINFAGGEPFLKEGLTDLIKFAHGLGFITAVCTNAYLIDKRMAQRIGDSGLNTIALSLDSLDQKRHDFLRGVSGSYSRVIRAIELLNQHATRTEVNVLTIIMQENLEDLIPLVEWVQSDKRLNMINFLGLVQPRSGNEGIQWRNSPEAKMLWPQDTGRVDEIIDRLMEMKNKGYPKVGNTVSQLLNFKKYYGHPEEFIRKRIKCNMGYLFLSVNEKGFVSLCEERDPIGNIGQRDINDLWFSEEATEEREQLRNCNKNCHQVINCCYEEEVVPPDTESVVPRYSVKAKSLELKNVLRRLKDMAGLLNNPGELIEYIEKMRQGSSDLNRLISIFPFDPELKNDNLAVFGHFDELHDRISGKEGSFNETTSKLKQILAERTEVVLKTGVTRYNFFCLDRIATFCLELKGIEQKPDLPSFEVFPLDKIMRNFVDYANEIKEKIESAGIEFVLCDEELVDILQIVQFHAQRAKISDKELARLLGIISEHAFIGPQTIVFDPYHRCNIQCKHCFVHNPLIHHMPGFLDRKFDYEMFKSIIDDAAELKVDGIILQGDGEPLLYHKFFDMLRYARGKDIGVLFFTNGSLIGQSEAEEIVRLGIREIYCSFPAGTPRTYEAVTTIGTEETFKTIVSNLNRLMQIKRKQGRKDPRLTMTHVLHKLNHHEIIEMARTDAEIGADAARFYLIRLDDNNKHLKLDDRELESIKRDLPLAARIFKESNIEFVDNIKFQLGHYDNDTGAWSKNIFLEEGCTIGWYFCLIPALYDVSLCCHLRTVGDLTKQSFKELWNSREYRSYRIKAKFLKDNRGFTFPNGVKLYDEHCEHCDNHQTLLTTLENLRKTGLYGFVKQAEK